MIDNYKKQAIKGVTWVGAFRGFSRIVAVVKTGILARILVPSQFGAYGIAALLLSFLEIFTETGINVFLIQEKDKNIDEYISTAWIVSIIRGMLMFTAILTAAPLVASFFNSQDAVHLIRLISVVALIRGFINPSIAKFVKELNFHKDFYYRFSIFLVDSVISIILAVTLRSASSLIWGLVAGAIFEVILSMLMVTPRPKFNFDHRKLKLIIGRGKWVNVSVTLNFFNDQADSGVIAKILNQNLLGIYQVAYRISTLPITEVSQVIGRVAFPMFVQINTDLKRLKNIFLKTWIVSIGLITPISFVIFFFPREIILLILGDKWLPAVDVLRILAIFGFFKSILVIPNALFNSYKKQDWVAKVTLSQFVVLAITIYPFVKYFGILGAGYSNLLSLIFVVPLVYYYLRKLLFRV